MKKHSSLYYWFWYRPLFRRLRLRLMTMVVALVLPVCLAGIVISFVSANQGAKLNYAIGNNGLGMFANSVAQRCHYEDIDLLSDFPTTFAGGGLSPCGCSDGRSGARICFNERPGGLAGPVDGGRDGAGGDLRRAARKPGELLLGE